MSFVRRQTLVLIAAVFATSATCDELDYTFVEGAGIGRTDELLNTIAQGR